MKRILILATALIFATVSSAQIINPMAAMDTVMTADDFDMRSTLTESTAVLTGNVVLEGTNLKISCDRLVIVTARVGDRDATIGEFKGFKSLIATGNVRLVQDDREATCGRAEVLPLQNKVVLTIDPIVIDQSSHYIAAGSEIIFYRGERRLHIKDPRFTGPPIKDLGSDAVDANDSAPATPTP